MKIKSYLHLIFKKIGKKRITLKDRYPEYQIGKESYGKLKIHSWDEEGSKLKIGAFCSFSSGVQILLGGNHQISWVTTFPLSVFWDSIPHVKSPSKTKGKVIIGNDVWVGTDAMILSGVTIGDGAVIGARSVITKDVPPFTIFAGNPAKKIGQRFDDKTIQLLLDIKWWEWDNSSINEAAPLLLSNDLEGFLLFSQKLSLE